MPQEKTELLALLGRHGTWCRDAEARDAEGKPVRFDDPSAVAWDLTGALCHLYGWQRACVLFSQFDRHIHGKRKQLSWPATDPDIAAMESLQVFNDRADTVFATIRELVQTMPTWRGQSRDASTGPTPAGVAQA